MNVVIGLSGIGFAEDVHARELFVLDRKCSSHIQPTTLTGYLIGTDDPILPVAKSISGDTGSDTAYRTVMKWIQECVQGHSLLCPPIVRRDSSTPEGYELPILPLRVVDIGSTEFTNVRLVETGSRRGHWACLSHCWGGQLPLMTAHEPDTLSQHLIDIAWDKLSKTFQEAIIFARRFGFQYLWVDSLCIFQDDDNDWLTQSAQMAYIYQNSVLTIAGSASSGPYQGLFRRAETEHLDHPTDFGKIRVRKTLTHKAADLPLLGRGWVHQERLLSPRFLHFGQQELIWECAQRLDCECGGAQYVHRLEVRKWPTAKTQFDSQVWQSHDSKPSLRLFA